VSAYYNEFDKGAAAWLRELIRRGLIAPGDVDERSIVDVRPDDLAGYRQCHFFAGIGGWSYALRLAGWPDDRPVWTGSCPCQPFSAAGNRKGFADVRHLWPVWFQLISECKPATVFGEQVASKDGLDWLDTVSADMEGAGYAIGAADLCAAGVGAPHIRQRLWFVADSVFAGRTEGRASARNGQASGRGAISVANAGRERHDGLDALLRAGEGGRLEDELSETAGCREARGVALGDTDNARLEGRQLSAERAGELAARPAGMGGLVNAASEQMGIPGRARVAGSACQWLAEWIACRDGKARPVEPGTFPLAHGIPARVGRLRGYGNAIVPQVAAEFIGAFVDSQEQT
jgi:DNA (cytosine-5)-methyltransferase 1